MPTPNELHIDRWLTDLSVDFQQDSEAFIADKVFPTVPVQKKSDKFIIFEKGSFTRNQVHERPLGGKLDAADWAKTDGTYNCVERGLAHKVDDRQRANTDQPLEHDRAAMRLLQTAVAINNDNRWASQYFTTGVWRSDLDGSTTDFTQFDDDSGSDPIGLIDTESDDMQLNSFKDPNTLVVTPSIHRELRTHSDIREVIKYTQRGIADRDILASLFQVDNYLVMKSIENTAAEGQTDSFSRIGTDGDMLLTYAADSPGLETPSAGYTFAWTGLLDGQANAMGGVVMRGRDDFAHSDHFEIRTANDINLVSSDLGTFFTNVVA